MVVALTHNVEMILVKLAFESVRVFLCCIYIPSEIDEIGYSPSDILCFVGDFNLPQVNCTNDNTVDCDDFAINLNIGNTLLQTGRWM